MKKIQLIVLSVLSLSLMTSCELNPFAIDTSTAELVRTKNDSVERISCHDEKASRIICFDEKDINTINKCFKRNRDN